MRNDVPPTGLSAKPNGFDGLGHGPDLIQLDKHGIGGFLCNAAFNKPGIGHIVVVSDYLDFICQHRGVGSEPLPVVFRKSIFD